MDKREYFGSVKDVIYLVYCAVNDKIPNRARTDKMNLENIYKAAEKHLLTSITASALESAGIKNSDFTQAKAKAMRKNAVLDLDRAALFDYFEKAGIWYMPLKGSVLKDYYPKYGMRQMADNDILFDKTYQAEVKTYFERNGFYTKSYKKGVHDVYMKEPVSNFEMHTALFARSFDSQIFEYYADVKNRLVRDENSNFGYHFTNEDLYLYITAHEYKHYSGGGTGLRSLVDTYIFLRKFGDSLDYDYISRELEKLDLTYFEEMNRSLSMNLFGGKKLTAENKEMLKYIIFSGTYGTIENSVKNRIKKADVKGSGKMRYLFGRLFLPLDTVKDAYPFFYKYKFLLPVLVLYRIGRALTVSRKNVLTEIKILLKTR